MCIYISNYLKVFGLCKYIGLEPSIYQVIFMWTSEKYDESHSETGRRRFLLVIGLGIFVSK